MELAALKERLRAIEPELAGHPWVVLHTFEREGRLLHLALTERLRKRARKEGVWRSPALCATLKNAAYGFDEQRARSGGGADGLFLLDRNFRPANAMMRKLFDHFLDKPGGGATEVAAALGVTADTLLPVRLVSHHLRLLGVLCRKDEGDWLVLVDCDRTK